MLSNITANYFIDAKKLRKYNNMETEKTINTFRNWKLYEELPDGWNIDKSCGSPLHGFEFCTNGISILKGGKRALVRVKKQNQ